MNPIRRIYTFFHKNLLTKTMAIGVVLALMGTTCLIQLANIQLVNGKGMAQAAAQSRTTTVTLKARRGTIFQICKMLFIKISDFLKNLLTVNSCASA